MSTNIIGSSLITSKQCDEFIRKYNHNAPFVADIYKRYCDIYGIRLEVAWAQMCLETNFLKYSDTSITTLDMNNFCGLGAVDGNGRREALVFKSKEEGIKCHIQHLYAYCSKKDLPKDEELVDCRFKYVQRGCAVNVEDLGGGNWASDKDYSKKLLDLLVRLKKEECCKMSIKVAVRRAHQKTGKDIGAEGFVKEIDVVEKYMPFTIEQLKAKGYEVLDVTPPEANRSLSDSLNYGINKAKEFGADLFISCHVNAFETTDKAMGGEVIFPPGDSVSRNYALDVCNVLKKNGFIDRGAKPDTRGLAEMNGSVGCPAIIIEPFFVDSKADVNNFNWVGGIKLGRDIGKALNVIPNPNKPQQPKIVPHIALDGGGTKVGDNLAINLIIRDFKDVDRIFGNIEGVDNALWSFDINPPNSNYAELKKNANQIAVYKSLDPNKEYKIIASGYKDGKKVIETSIVLKTLEIKEKIKENIEIPIENSKIEKTQETGKLYKVQVGAFRNKEYAENLLKELKGKGYNGFIKEE